MKSFWFVLLVFVVPVAAPAEQTLINTKAPDFHLSDQYDRLYSLESFSGRPVVLLASDRGGENQNHEWGELIGRKYGKHVKIAGVADVRSVPFFLKGTIKNNFKKDKNPILLDWDGILFTSYGLKKGVSNVVLIDGAGRVKYLHSGRAEQGALDDLFREIDRALE